MPKYLLIMRGTDESNAAMMASIEEGIARTRLFIAEMMKAGVLLGAEGLDDPGRGAVVDFNGALATCTCGYAGAGGHRRFNREANNALKQSAAARPELHSGRTVCRNHSCRGRDSIDYEVRLSSWRSGRRDASAKGHVIAVSRGILVSMRFSKSQPSQ